MYYINKRNERPVRVLRFLNLMRSFLVNTYLIGFISSFILLKVQRSVDKFSSDYKILLTSAIKRESKRSIRLRALAKKKYMKWFFYDIYIRKAELLDLLKYYYNYKRKRSFNSFTEFLKAREVYLDKVVGINEHPFPKEKILRLIEKGRYKCAIHIINKSGKNERQLNDVEDEHLVSFMTLINNTNSDKFDAFRKSCQSNNSDINLIENKRVALIGPGEMSRADLEKINAADLFAYTNRIISPLDQNKGKKSVVYYNVGTIKTHGKQVRAILPEYDQAIFRRVCDIAELEKKAGKSECHVRDIHPSNNLVISDYGPMGLQYAVYDLLFSGAKSVFIIGFDFFTSEIQYRKDDHKHMLNKVVTERSLREHEAFSNFIFIKQLVASGRVIPVGKAKEVLSLSALQYASVLDKRFTT